MLGMLLLVLLRGHEAIALQDVVENAAVVPGAGAPTETALQGSHDRQAGRSTCAGGQCHR